MFRLLGFKTATLLLTPDQIVTRRLSEMLDSKVAGLEATTHKLLVAQHAGLSFLFS